ncbi:Major facilitator superfamily domain-containing protein 6 [Araneus ventricosus]|uniref:Major facilitator superfamily domain-containing protein 6 n=1 Tax=Araneus ventricosus TaxID=182803 RepID=A0A4Y2CKP8_ARAVE|nr:Major facilitator superfamily domain-containing protein 6 [Araneus ventricosus]
MELSLEDVSTETKEIESSGKMPIACKKERWWHVDREMVYFKLHFFLLSGALGAVLPFVGVFAKERLRLSATSFASVLTVQQFLFVLTKPALGFITDYFNKLKVILVVLAIAQAGFLFLLLLVPPLPKGLAADDNDVTINSSMQAVDACNFCNDMNDSSNVLKIPINYTVTSKDIYFAKENGKCNVLEVMPSDSLEQYVKLIIPFECDPFRNRPLDKSDKNQDVFEEQSVLSHSEKSVNFTSCFNISKTSCVVSLDDCILCCNREEGCYFIPNDMEERKVDPDSTTDDNSSRSDFAMYQFWLFAILFVALNACVNGIFTLSDTACCESVEKTGADFGKQRLWGCIGWGMFSPLGGFLNDYTGNYVATWIFFVVLSSLALWNITKLNLEKPHISKHLMKDIGTVISSWEFICFQIGALLSGIGLGFTFFYLLWFITSIGGSSLLCGLIQTVQSFSGDIPFMFFSGWMLRKLGYFNIVTLSLLACCVRFLWYSQLENPWLVLPIEWTHGITYGVFIAAIASFAKMSAKPGTEATTQSVIFTTFDGLGSGIGNIVAGVGFDYVGGHTMFLCTGTFFGCAAALSFVATVLTRNRVKHLKE